MLRACRRVLKADGLLGFLVIVVSEGLSTVDRDEAIVAGPEFVRAEPGYRALMTESGFVDVELEDVTPEYAETAAAWRTEWDREAEELKQLVGHDEFLERQARRERSSLAIESGLLRRFLVTGRARR